MGYTWQKQGFVLFFRIFIMFLTFNTTALFYWRRKCGLLFQERGLASNLATRSFFQTILSSTSTRFIVNNPSGKNCFIL